jgi:three-Cys-motif partner protein
MAKNINKKPFDEATKIKLEIFRECFREWLPVFIHNPAIDRIYIYDFFAGSGTDSEGNSGSPLILLNEAKGENCKVCKSIGKKKIIFGFNELLNDKNIELKNSIENYIGKCIKDNCKRDECRFKWHVGKYEFKEAFNGDTFKSILNNNRYAKFILLDQYGFKQVDDVIFKELVIAPKTDFIFFIASSFIDRFKEHPNTKKYIDTSIIAFENIKPKEKHKAVAKYFRNLIDNSNYYIHDFTIRKGANQYGLIFGSGHSLGMEKFLKVCWKKDKYAGESNDNIYNDYQEGTLFHNPQTSNKKEIVKEKLKAKILNGEITNNIDGFKQTLSELCMPIIFTEVVQDLEKKGLILRTGDINNQSVGIHRCKEYKIKRLIK